MLLLDKLDTAEDREWYARQCVTDGWSRAILAYQIDTRAKDRHGAAPSNFEQRLDPFDSDLAHAMIKDPYVFEHVALTDPLVEREVEEALMNRLQDTMMELGRGMAGLRRAAGAVHGRRCGLLGRPHLLPRRAVAVCRRGVEGQAVPPGLGGSAGHTYVAIVDDVLRKPTIHAPTVGLLLCTGKRDAIVRYALASSTAPIAVAQWQGLPEDARAALPRAEELEAVVQDEYAHQLALRQRASPGGEPL